MHVFEGSNTPVSGARSTSPAKPPGRPAVPPARPSGGPPVVGGPQASGGRATTPVATVDAQDVVVVPEDVVPVGRASREPSPQVICHAIGKVNGLGMSICISCTSMYKCILTLLAFMMSLKRSKHFFTSAPIDDTIKVSI